GVGEVTGGAETVGLFAVFEIENRLLHLACNDRAITAVTNVVTDHAGLNLRLVRQLHDLLNFEIRGGLGAGRAEIKEQQDGGENGQPDQGNLKRKSVRRQV